MFHLHRDLHFIIFYQFFKPLFFHLLVLLNDPCFSNSSLPLQCWLWGLMVCQDRLPVVVLSCQITFLGQDLFREHLSFVWRKSSNSMAWKGVSSLLKWVGTSTALPRIWASLKILEIFFFLFYPFCHLQQFWRQWRNKILWILQEKKCETEKQNRTKQKTNSNHLCLNSGVNRICLIPQLCFLFAYALKLWAGFSLLC